MPVRGSSRVWRQTSDFFGRSPCASHHGEHGHGGISGAPRRVSGTLAGGGASVRRRFVWPQGGLRAHGCRWWAHRVARRASGQRPARSRFSTKSRWEVHRRRTTRIGAPQVGQRAARGAGGCAEAAGPRGVRRHDQSAMVARARAQRAWSKPTWRTVIKPSGQNMRRKRRETRGRREESDGAGTTPLAGR